MRDWVGNVHDTFYIIGTAAGPSPYPRMVRDFNAVVGKEARAQMQAEHGRLPDAVVACVGGGSNAIGIFHPFLNDAGVALWGAEAAGEGIATGRHAASLAAGRPGVLHGNRTYLICDDDGQVIETHSISAGLDYPGVGPEHAFLKDSGRARYEGVTDAECMEAFHLLARTEGILAALESSHAVALAMRLARGCRRMRWFSPISPAAATRTSTPSPSARASGSRPENQAFSPSDSCHDRQARGLPPQLHACVNDSCRRPTRCRSPSPTTRQRLDPVRRRALQRARLRAAGRRPHLQPRGLRRLHDRPVPAHARRADRRARQADEEHPVSDGVSTLKVSPEFFARVNEILAVANGIAKQHTLAHAQMALLHAMSRYGAHHYLRVTTDDSAELRQKFSNDIGALLTDLVARNIQDMSASIRAAAAAGASAPDAGASAPASATDSPPAAAGEQ
jgi:hypothetical protein